MWNKETTYRKTNNEINEKADKTTTRNTYKTPRKTLKVTKIAHRLSPEMALNV